MNTIRKTPLKLLLLLTAHAVSIDPHARAQTVTNGDFELPGLSASVYQSNNGYAQSYQNVPAGSQFIPGWRVSGNGCYYFGAPFGRVVSTSGKHYVDLYRYVSEAVQRGVTIAHDVRDLKVGTNYFLFFDLFQSSLGPNSILTVRIGDAAVTVLNETFGRWQTHSIPFVAEADTVTVSFSTPDRVSPSVRIDSVRVSERQNAPVVLAAKPLIGINVGGKLGNSYRVEYSESIRPEQWFFLTRVTVTNDTTVVYDEVSPESVRRIYRSVEE